jgi:hypothetical protein
MQPQDTAGADVRVRELTRSLHGDAALEAWARKIQAQADAFRLSRKPDPLDQFLITHLR